MTTDHTACPTERPDWACVLCGPPTEGRDWRKADDGYKTCTGCLDRLRGNLNDVAVRYRKLNATPTSSGEPGGRGAPGFGSKSPASEHVISMRDPRSSTDAWCWRDRAGRMHKEQEHPPLSVFGVLDTIAWGIAEERGISGPQMPRRRPHSIAEARQCRIVWRNGRPRREDPPPSAVDSLVQFIDHQLDWLTRRPDVVDVAHQVARLLGQLRSETGERKRKIGQCPNVLDHGEETEECGAPLFAPVELGWNDSIRCHKCGRTWPRSEWLRLVDMLEAS